nr:CRISPR-associated endonuclease Cas3'' [Colwellia sp.]
VKLVCNLLLLKQIPENSIVISNTATTAQQAFIFNQSKENAIVFHGKFKAADKQIAFNNVYKSFKQNGSKEFSPLRSGPIVQASLNITCQQMVTEFTLAENWLQRLGRLDRFGENNNINRYITAIPEQIKSSSGKIKGNCARFLNNNHSYRSAYAWYEFLQNELDEKPITINHIYQLYEEFYKSNKGQQAVTDDLLKSLKNSVQVIHKKVHDPLRFSKKKKLLDKKKLKKSSLRGDSRFVQMAICEISKSSQVKLLNEYACDNVDNTYTMSIDEIEAYDPSGDKNLLSFMHQKHHKILSAKTEKNHKQAHKSFMLKNQAVEPETPIFVSYTQTDLALTNDQNKAQSNAIYYVKGIKQIIGAMALDKINFQSNQ